MCGETLAGFVSSLEIDLVNMYTRMLSSLVPRTWPGNEAGCSPAWKSVIGLYWDAVVEMSWDALLEVDSSILGSRIIPSPMPSFSSLAVR